MFAIIYKLTRHQQWLHSAQWVESANEKRIWLHICFKLKIWKAFSIFYYFLFSVCVCVCAAADWAHIARVWFFWLCRSPKTCRWCTQLGKLMKCIRILFVLIWGVDLEKCSDNWFRLDDGSRPPIGMREKSEYVWLKFSHLFERLHCE